jgi:hypothetical protein
VTWTPRMNLLAAGGGGRGEGADRVRE